MKQYKLFNNIFGWLAFAIATIVYVMTIEPTTSFWDCGEFIATSYKLEVGHPPGAPFFMILARFFSLFASDVSQVAKMVNMLSALASSFTILFLFWTITHLARKIIVKVEEITTGNAIAIISSGLVGALAFTFSDTFWFSAVEGEVYASSSLFTAVVFWAILKWEDSFEEKYANRWLVLIAYLMGLSIGVHLLNLLAIPAIAFVYYFKKSKEVTRKGVIMALLVSVVMLGLIMYGIIPGAITMASVFELMFVNSMGMGFNSGLIIYIIILVACLVLSVYFTSKPDSKKNITAILFSVTIILLGIPLFLKNFLVIFPIAAVIIFAFYMVKRSKEVMNTILLCCTVILIGYSSFSMIVIRSLANPPMDENNPENAFALLSYLNREQYGDRPLFYGHYFNSPHDPSDPYKNGDPNYVPKDDKYVISGYKQSTNYLDEYCSVFPRMYSQQEQHIRDYLHWIEHEEKEYFEPLRDSKGEYVKQEGKMVYDHNNPKKKPSFGDNLKFFFKYQMGHMYFRYFMWNFSGRQNDIQGHGEIMNGNWISGINMIDEAKLGPQELLPDIMKENKARNYYFMIPLILGIIGFLFQMQRHNKGFWVVFLLFFFTGVAIVIYLNQYPHQPRERDYAFAGSFYTFAIWIGLGVLALYEAAKKFSVKNYVWYGAAIMGGLAAISYLFGGDLMAFGCIYVAMMIVLLSGIMMLLGKVLKNNIIRAVLALLLTLPCPIILANQNWDDHDRSNRYTALHFATNYLNSCAPNAILFTNGDNDTFPLWYAQEVEGIRTDVRVCNLSLLNTDWYIDQMSRKAYESEAMPFTLTPDKYVQGTRDYVTIQQRVEGYKDIGQVMKFVASDSDETKYTYGAGEEKLDFIPTNKILVPVDSAKVVNNGTVKPEMASEIVDNLRWDLNKRVLMKGELMVFDLMATNNWERPVYYAITVGNSSYLNLQKYFQLEGLAYRIVPIEDKSPDRYMLGRIDTDIMYDNMMNKFKWGGINDPRVYLDENNIRMTMNFRNNFARLASELLAEGKRDSAVQVLDKCVDLMPDSLVPYNYFNLALADVYYRADKMDKANDIIIRLMINTSDNIDYFYSLPQEYMAQIDEDLTRDLTVYNRMMELTEMYKQTELSETITSKFEEYYSRYVTMRSQNKN